MADEPNIPSHRYYGKGKHVRLAKSMMTKALILDAGVTLIDGGLSLSAQVQAILAGTAGFALDPTDVSTMWQDTGTVTSVSAPADPVGHIRSKWGTTTRDLTQATPGSRPAYNGASLTFDGTDDRLFAAATDILQNAPGGFIAAQVRFDGWANTQDYMLWIAASLASNPRLAFRTDTPGTDIQLRRRANADATTSLSSSTSPFASGVSQVVSTEVDYVGGTTITRRNGTQIATNVLAGSGNTENVASAQISLGSNNGPSFFMQGRIGRVVVCPFIPSAGQRATIEAWCSEVAL